MQKQLNDAEIMATMLTEKGQCLFIQKWAEMLDARTLDTYQYRMLNTHGILRELAGTIPLVRAGDIGGTNIADIVEEAAYLAKRDTVLERHNGSLKGAILSALKVPKKEDPAQTARLAYQVGSYLRLLDSDYLGWIVSDVKEAIDHNELADISVLSSLLASELVERGWAPRSLNNLKAQLLDSRIGDFGARWRQFVSLITAPMASFHCYFTCKSVNRDLLAACRLECVTGAEIVKLHPTTRGKVSVGTLYIHVPIDAFPYDLHTAVDRGRQALLTKRAAASFREDPFIGDDSVIVVFPDGLTNTAYSLSDGYWKQIARPVENNPVAAIRFTSSASTALSNLDEASRRRLLSLFLQYQSGYESMSLNAWFLSTWICLESFVRTGEHRSIADHVKRIVPAIHSKGYLYRILRNFLEDCGRVGVSLSYNGTTIATEAPSRSDTERLLQVIRNTTELARLRTDCLSQNTLLCCRLDEIASSFNSGKELGKTVDRHFRNLAWHLQRLYRVRNTIMHSSATDNDLIPLASQLNRYLRVVVADVLHTVRSEGITNLGVLFSLYQDNHVALVKVLDSDPSPPDPKLIAGGVLFH